MRVSNRSQQVKMFELDLRAIGVFRIALGIIVLADQIVRLNDWQAFNGPDSFGSRELAIEWEGAWIWSLYWLSESPLLPYILEAARLGATLLLILGVRSRTMAFVVFVLVSSVINHNLTLIQGGDRVLTVMLFFSVFLPLGSRYSLEALWHGPSKKKSVRSIGTAGYMIQVLLVFLVSGLLKMHPAWTSDYTAISMALHLEAFATETARLWRHLDEVTKGLTFVVIWIEWLAPVVALSPGIWARTIGVGALIMLEAGIWLSLEVGLFPFISVISLLPLVPGRWIDAITRKKKEETTEWHLFYDQNCRFCLFACQLLRAVCGLHGARISQAQEDPTARRILDEARSWSVRRGDDDQGSHGWEAVRELLDASGRGWIARRLPRGPRGDQWYTWIGEHRETFGCAGRIAFGRRRLDGPGEFGQAMAGVAIAAVIAWNVVSYPAIVRIKNVRSLVNPIVGTLNLKQKWSMFAPAPYYNDWWLVGMGLDRDGGILNLFTGEPMPETIRPPVDGPDHYGGYKWRKSLNVAYRRNKMEHVLAYWCRTERWQAVAVWGVKRKNLGSSTTVKEPYRWDKEWLRACNTNDAAGLTTFQDDVVYRREMGIEIGPAPRGLEGLGGRE